VNKGSNRFFTINSCHAQYTEFSVLCFSVLPGTIPRQRIQRTNQYLNHYSMRRLAMKTNMSKLFTLLAVAFVSSLATLVITLNVSAGAPQQLSGNENHVITLDQAIKLVQNYQTSPRVPSIKGGYFGRSIFDKILAQNGCVGVRFYYAQKDDGTSTMVLVGVDNTMNDITGGVLGDIILPCPPYCNGSVLNK
jgi:hypothetical protein